LPELVPRIDGVPADVVDAAARLAFTTAVMVNLGVDRDDLSEAHITYVYDEDIIFPRLNFPHMLSAGNVPPGTGSIQVEVYFSDKYRPLDRPPEALIDPVVTDLHKLGVLEERDRVLFSEARLVRYANVIYDLERADAVRIIHGFLDDVGIRYCGRYGDWNHEWTDEAFLSGEQAASVVLAT
jgi:protoporphyrinogen oxidase